jgi:tetratricopeptide (TPR) repeat protein/membrane-associated protease RseP (regulator of RpoE activity)
MSHLLCFLALTVACPDDATPQFQRQLSPQTAKRVDQLEQEIQDTVVINDSAMQSLQGKAREMHQLLEKELGASHWRTIDAKLHLAIASAILKMSTAERWQMTKATEASEEASQLSEQGLRSEAINAYRRAVELSQKLFGPQHINTIRVRNNMALELSQAQRLEEARGVFQEVLEQFQRQLGPRHPEVGTALNNLATVYQSMGDQARALSHAEKAVEITYDAYGEYSEDTATALGTLGAILVDNGRLREAAETQRRVLAIRLKILPADAPKTALTHNNLGDILAHLGRLAEARGHLIKALEVYKRTLTDYDERVIDLYSDLATCLSQQGHIAEALELNRKALALQQTLQADSPAVAKIYDALSYDHLMLGNATEALNFGKLALTLREKLRPPAHPELLLSKINFATELLQQESFADVHRLLSEAEAQLQAKYPPVHQLRALAFFTRGEYFGKLGKLPEAAEQYRQAHGLYQQLFAPEHRLTLRALTARGVVASAQGKDAQAEKWLKEAMRSHEKGRSLLSVQGLERAYESGRTTPAFPLALTLVRQKRPRDAFAALETALGRGLADEQAQRAQQRYSPQQQRQLRTLEQELHGCDLEFARLQQQESTRPEALNQLRFRQVALEARYRELEQQLQTEYGSVAYEPATVERIQAALRPEQALLCWLDYRLPPTPDRDQGEHWACVLRREGDPIWIDLTLARPRHVWSKDDGKLAGQVGELLRQLVEPMSLTREAALNRQLQDKLVELVDQRIKPILPALQASNHLPAASHWIILPSTQMLEVPIAVLSPLSTISYAPSGTFLTRQAADGTTAKKRLLLVADPVFPQPAQSREPDVPETGLFVAQIVPKSPAEQLPLKPGDVILRYHGQKVASKADLKTALQQAPSGKVVVQCWRAGKNLDFEIPGGEQPFVGVLPSPQTPRQAARADQILAIIAGGRPLNDGRWRELPGARSEAAALQELFTAHHAEVTRLDRESATAGHLRKLAQKQDLARYRYLHFITHGQSSTQSDFAGSIILSNVPGQTETAQGVAVQDWDDGQITAKEIQQTWQLNADLVTLSACETVRGRSGSGEGLLGFSQTLLLAGARSVVLSQWKVEDRATALLMRRFYANLLGTDGRPPAPKAQALAEARQWLRQLTNAEANQLLQTSAVSLYRDKNQPKLEVDASPIKPNLNGGSGHPFEHPKFWGAFILIGQPD